MVWIWQHDKRTDDYKIILNCVRNRKRGRERSKPFLFVFLKFFHIFATKAEVALTSLNKLARGKHSSLFCSAVVDEE